MPVGRLWDKSLSDQLMGSVVTFTAQPAQFSESGIKPITSVEEVMQVELEVMLEAN